MEQRELKFRAWDKKEKNMMDLQFWELYIRLEDNKIVEIGEYSGYGGGGKTEDDVSDRYKLLQYIELKDKSEKEIYEGDIVKTNRGRICEVRWHSSNNSASWDLHPLEFKNPAPSQNAIWRDIEVIGNIYENPELLK